MSHLVMSKSVLKDLLEWGEARGCVISSTIGFQYDSTKGICGVAKEQCSASNNNFIIELPNDLIITDRLAQDIFGQRGNGWLKLLVARLKFDQSENTKVKKLQTKFQPYINALPNVIDSPLTWNPQEHALLHGTNLENSFKENFSSIFKEWLDIVNSETGKAQKFELNEIEKTFANSMGEIDITYIYENIVLNTVNRTPTSWYSFSAFLWAHLIFTSRAFPEHIIDPNCKESNVMLLPIVDLLNHGNRVRAEWSTDDEGSFYYKSLEEYIEIGDEILNNYGAKSNEELLYGYGFVLDNNEFDSVLLRIQLPLSEVQYILEHKPHIQLPLIDDYTTFAFDLTKENKNDQKGRKASDYEGGILFLLNKLDINTCLQPILDLFGYLVLHKDGEHYKSIRATLDAIQSLRAALNRKLDKLSIVSDVNTNDKFHIHDYRRHCATIYRNGQVHILTSALKELKRLEKKNITENKNSLLTTSKILKYDTAFPDDISELFSDLDHENEVVFETNFEIFVVWIICKVKFQSFPKKYEWVSEQYNIFKDQYDEINVSQEAVDLYLSLFNEGEDSEGRIKPFNVEEKPLSMQELSIAYDFIQHYSFTRYSLSGTPPETIFVKAV